jgi:hypothetical protein
MMHRSPAPSIAPGTFFVAQPGRTASPICPDLIYDRHSHQDRLEGAWVSEDRFAVVPANHVHQT